MAPNKKKKKPSGNPARGFATTSIASKPKQENPAATKEDATLPNEEDQPDLHPTSKPPANTEPTLQKAEPTPEELEAQLEHDELQLLVEKHAPKVRRESRRHTLKFQTDRRVLRAAAEPLTTHEWLSNDVMEAIIGLAQTESNDSNRRQGQQSLVKILSEEDALFKLWMLDLTLREMSFTHNQIEPVLRWLCANAATIDASATVWGLQEALEWLALHNSQDHTFSYDEIRTARPAASTPSTSRPVTPLPDLPLVPETTNSSLHKRPEFPSAIPIPATVAEVSVYESDVDNVDVSDLDSDIEPDQLISTYIKIKGKLYEMDPDAVESKSRKQSKGNKSRIAKPPLSRQSPATRKLLAQLHQLEADALFDPNEAEILWPAKRNQIAQSKAAQRQEQASAPLIKKAKSEEDIREEARKNTSETSFLIQQSYPEKDNEDEQSLLGHMFAEPEDTTTSVAAAQNTSISLRDFGKQTGISPRRVLEETVRARDSGARMIYKLVSPTTYSCRHSLTILWSKPHDSEYDAEFGGVDFTISASQVTFEASTIATVSVEQSEGFVSTVALFSICAPFSKDEKVYLRLPSNWRDLYKDMLEGRQSRIDTTDRGTVKHLRSLIQDQLDIEESDGVVLTSRFRARNQAAASSSASSSGQTTPSQPFDGLRDLWSQKAATVPFHRMLSARSTLPVFAYRDVILSTVDKHQVTIICGETGCGKSTQIPSFLLEHELSQGKPCKIYCTEPRRISAISLAQRVSDELGEGPNDLGTPRSLVGYAIRLESKTSTQTRLVYATVGVVLRMLESSNALAEISHLLIDEVHERSIDSDFLLIILRSLMAHRPELKVILMSATVDAQRFSNYLDGAPVLNIPGRTFPVQTKYLEDVIELTHYTRGSSSKLHESDASSNEDDAALEKSGIPSKLSGYSVATRNVLAEYDEYAIDYDLILRLMEKITFDTQLSRYSSAILCFLPGIAEIRQLNDLLIAHPSFDTGWLIYPLHSTISSEEQQAAFLIPPPGMRKIVIATNIAETGVTIPDVTCVIDTGKHKEMRFDERRQLSRLTQSFISRANAKQRRGRAGRVQEGVCFHLFTKYRHDTLMVDQQTPEMLRLSLQDLVMRTKICKLGDIEKTLSEALDPPSARNIRRAIDALIEVDALTPGEELTPLGRQIAKLPLDAHLGKLVLLAAMFGCVDVAITIAAILSSKSPFLTPFGAKQRADIARMAFKKGDSDLLTTYNAYKSWKSVCTTPGHSEAQFCHKNFLSAQNLGNIEDLKAQLLSSLVEAGFLQMSYEDRRSLSRYRSTSRHRVFVTVPLQYDKYSENDILVNSIIAAAFYPKILIREGKGWRNISNNQTVSLTPTSVNKATPVNPSSVKHLSYYHIMQSSNKFYNAHSTSIVHILPMVIMAAADMDFKLHAGVISLPSNVLKFAVKDWQVAVALKVLRRRIREILSAGWKNPGRQLNQQERQWISLFFKIFEERFTKEERVREKGAAKAK